MPVTTAGLMNSTKKVFRAYFTEVKDIGRMDVIMDAARSAGLDAEGLQLPCRRAVTVTRLQKAQQESERYGVTGVPAFIIDEQI